ncbi:ABC transporter permease [Saccharospirillum salsuginis]|uniref:ABC transporter permease n=1 Tax=Saccharospirillum salsuginis TaxID=418750 RepID=A0A918KBL3_9GAMM|nr:ABC transporter permease [Saccharospirillum salsuginis]GGX57918.1 ABC transporter permease [Saccharospirillum salsuginis]
MLTSYLILALRTLLKHRLFAMLNVFGLALGLMVFLFSSLLVHYERTHDQNFTDYDRIYLIGSRFTFEANEPISEYPDIRTAYGPLFERHIEGLDAVARAVHRRPILTAAGRHQYQSIRFVDPAFTRIFSFDYLAGSGSSLDSPDALILTRSTAMALFGRVDVLHEPVRLNHTVTLTVSAVIEDAPVNTHFNSDLRDHYELTALAPIAALNATTGFPQAGRWTDEFENNATYIKVAPGRDRAWLNERINRVYREHAPTDEQAVVQGLNANPLINAHNLVWQAMELPVLETVQLLGLLVLVVACVNYANLATALNLGRRREVGLRKVLGASRRQLLAQFLVESLLMVALAMLLATACIEVVLPAFNHWTGKALTLNYGLHIPWVLITTVLVALVAGAYPAWVISRPHPIDALGYAPEHGGGGRLFRTLLVGLQFTVAIFMLAMVMIIIAQNQNILSQSRVFPMSRMLILDQLEHPSVHARRAELVDALAGLDGVEAVTLSNGYPFNPTRLSETGRLREARAAPGSDTASFVLDMIAVDDQFLAAYGIPMLAGRPFEATNNSGTLEAVINPQAARQLGFTDAENAIGVRFQARPPDSDTETLEAMVVGIIAEQQFNGSYSERSAMAFYPGQDRFHYASILLTRGASPERLETIRTTWTQIIDDVPINALFLEEYFNWFYKIPRGIQWVFSVFSMIALGLSLTGLFGLVALMAQRRTREIGVRKVLGASTGQIVQMMLWQFSRPIVASVLVATPLAYGASTIYLDFFPDPVSALLPIIGLASMIVISLAWLTIAAYTHRLARATPIDSLRYE